MSTNPHYEAWVAATGGGPNWEYMRWIERRKREWLTYCVSHDLGVPLFDFTHWLEVQNKMTNKRKNITQPADWWAAWKAAADREGVSLSEWIGTQCNAALTKTAAKKLTERPPAHRPRTK